ncbi:SDR family oxidoreductase [Cellulophaga sp. E16_2]|uniref:SDR family oxidoreductase n=1 Tax=Cellulophaga sp. E16_2 TaxID=2789297 RepID=UPI001A9281A2|nr:SDR family oxidoreductase [Cellulophaga sp. E16_2]MBO0593226.1 SDR family oxidoreductase [Cellulophaga sp. E16_2]
MSKILKEKDEKEIGRPGLEADMNEKPEIIKDSYKGSGKLEGKVALITGGDSGIGRAIAVHFAREGADIAIAYLNERKDAEETAEMVEKEGRNCIKISGDLKNYAYCQELIETVIKTYGKIDILVNNAATQYVEEDFSNISVEHLEETFKTNILSMIYLTQQAYQYMEKGARIINTTSITGYKGHNELVDYASTKGAITSFTRSLSAQLAPKGILVNGVAPGPIWTPLIPATMTDIGEFGKNTPLGRCGQPSEVAPAYVYLAAEDSCYMTGQILHINGGIVVGG